MSAPSGPISDTHAQSAFLDARDPTGTLMPIVSPTGVPGCISADRTRVIPGRPLPLHDNPFRLPNVSRFRPLDAEVVSAVLAEYASVLNDSSSAAMIPKDSEMYPRLMLKHRHGYPLYGPEPTRSLPIEYMKKGVRIGDVGRITPDGAFDFLFNVDSSQADSINPPTLLSNFETVPSIESLSNDYFPPGECLLSDYVKQTREDPITYKFLAPEGAVLQLPEGASIFEARNINDLRDLAIRQAWRWYEYVAANISREIPNGSLYLVTGCIKTTNWGIGTFFGRQSDSGYLELVSEDQPARRRYSWRKMGSISAKIGASSKDIEEPNQCVFIRGYKIALGEKIWKKLKGGAASVPLGKGTCQCSSLPSMPCASTPGHVTHSLMAVPDLEGLSISETAERDSEQSLLEGILSVQYPMHPLNLVVATLIRLEPDAEVVLVHDNEWRDCIPEGFGSDLEIGSFLKKIAQSCLAAVDQNGSVSLVRKPTVENAMHNEWALGCMNEIASASAESLEDDLLARGSDREKKINVNMQHIQEKLRRDDWGLGTETALTFNSAITMAFDRDMPTELVAEILNSLDFPSMLKCRTVCSTFRDLLDSSPNFHWQVELAVAGKEDGGNYSLTASRNMLEQYQQGWANLKWTKELRMPNILGRVWELHGNILALHSADKSTIQFKQLPSESRNIKERDWVVDVREVRMEDLTLDSAQDLLVVVEYPFRYKNEYNRQIFFWKLSTGDPHPLTMGTHTITHASTHDLLLRDQSPIMICGDTLAVLFNSPELDETEIILWNWKTGDLLTNIVTKGITAMTFLNEKYIMFGILQSPMEPGLVVVDFTAHPPERRQLHHVEGAFIFRFPTLSGAANIVDLNIRSFPAPSWKPDPELSVPFFAARHNRLYLATLLARTSIGLTWEVQLYALGSSFLSPIEKAAGPNTVYLDWHMWGPEGTRMMLSPFSHSETWTRYVYGTRHVSTKRPQGFQADFVYVHDFNELGLRWSRKNSETNLASSGTDIGVKDAMDEEDAEVELSSFDVTAPTKIANNDIFQDEVETKLGYTVKRWAIPGRPRVRSAMCNEDGLVIMYGENVGHEFHILTV